MNQSTNEIIDTAARCFNVDRDAILGFSDKWMVIKARNFAVWSLREHQGMKWVEIEEIFGRTKTGPGQRSKWAWYNHRCYENLLKAKRNGGE